MEALLLMIMYQPDGTLGNFQKNFKVYGREGYKIKGCEIKKVVLHGRSTFFCPDYKNELIEVDFKIIKFIGFYLIWLIINQQKKDQYNLK